MGQKLQVYGTKWLEIIRWIIFAAVIIKLIAVMTNLEATIPVDQILIIGSISLFTILFIVVQRTRPEIHVYENGIGIVKGDDEKTWRWNQLTNMQGTRTTHALYGVIPIVSYGANHFYAGEEKAFSVGVLTSQANALVEMILMKMTLRDLPRFLESYKRGETVPLGEVQLNLSGICYKNKWTQWTDITSIEQKNGKVHIQSTSNNRTIKIDMGVFALRGLLIAMLDHIRFTQMLKTLENEHLNPGIWKSLRQPLLVMLIVIAAIAFIFGAPALSKQNQAYQAQQARDELIALAGANTMSFCSGRPVKADALSSQQNHYVIIDMDHQSIYKRFQDALQTAEKATSPEDVTAIVCVEVQPVQVEECLYEDRQSYYEDGVFEFYVNRYRKDLRIRLIDFQTYAQVGQLTLRGSIPPQCPNTASISQNDIYGQEPASSDFLDWLRELDPGSNASV